MLDLLIRNGLVIDGSGNPGCGYTAVHDAPSDLYGTILGERFDQDAVVQGVSGDDRVTVYRIERNYFKFHACCLYNHPVLDAVHSLVRGEGLWPTTSRASASPRCRS